MAHACTMRTYFNEIPFDVVSPNLDYLGNLSVTCKLTLLQHVMPLTSSDTWSIDSITNVKIMFLFQERGEQCLT